MKNNELDCILLRKKPNCMPHIEYHGTSSCVSPVAFLVNLESSGSEYTPSKQLFLAMSAFKRDFLVFYSKAR